MLDLQQKVAAGLGAMAIASSGMPTTPANVSIPKILDIDSISYQNLQKDLRCYRWINASTDAQFLNFQNFQEKTIFLEQMKINHQAKYLKGSEPADCQQGFGGNPNEIRGKYNLPTPKIQNWSDHFGRKK